MRFNVGDEIEVLVDQNWMSAVIEETAKFGFRVTRADGQYRLVMDPNNIRSKASGETERSLDIPGNSPVQQAIEIKEFNVLIPAGSVSLKIEQGCNPSTEQLNRSPLAVNKETWLKNLKQGRTETDALIYECGQIAQNPAFKPNSSKQCAEIFFQKRGHPVQRTSKVSGEPTMDKETLATIASYGDDLAQKVIDAREAISRQSQLEAWEPHAQAGQVQANWNQNGTPMARYACDSPNLQNRITQIRETVEAPQGYTLLSLDLGQAEYVTWASLSGDTHLQAIFKSGDDLHTTMITEIQANLAKPLNLKPEELRPAGKTINFALLYLMQPFSLAKKLNCTQEEANAVIAIYRSRAPAATSYMEDYLKTAKPTGSVSTDFGRRRHLPGWKDSKGSMKHEMDKTAWHHHNAGTAAELLKIKQVRCHNAFAKLDLPETAVRLGLQMHDELIYIVRDDVLEQVKEITMEQFKRPTSGFLDFKIDQRTGPTWLSISK